jgi:hypothetical protein
VGVRVGGDAVLKTDSDTVHSYIRHQDSSFFANATSHSNVLYQAWIFPCTVVCKNQLALPLLGVPSRTEQHTKSFFEG